MPIKLAFGYRRRTTSVNDFVFEVR
jgi:hypothetical protein